MPVAETRQPPCVAIVGFGAIGHDLCRRVLARGLGVAVLLREDGETPVMEHGAEVTFVRSIEALAAAQPALAVEAAGQDALKAVALPLLAAGIDLVAASVGAAGDDGFMAEAEEAARSGGARLVFPTGAVGGLDYLAAVADACDLAVTYVSRKPVAAWSAELAALGHSADALESAVTLFEGSAAEAARLYPRNLNAGLTVALAAGPSRTKVRVVADPAVGLNTHEIEVHSAYGDAFMRFANRPSPDNPKTSAITAASLMAEVDRRLCALENRRFS